MIGLVLVTHGQLATEFRAALEHVVGHQEAFEAVSIGPEDNMEERRRDIVAAVDRVNDGSGVILLTDMFGGTPSNLAISVMDPGKVEVVAGVQPDAENGGIRVDGWHTGRCFDAIHQRRFGFLCTDARRVASGHRQTGGCTPAPPRALSNALKASTARSRRQDGRGGTHMGLMTLAAVSRPSTAGGRPTGGGPRCANGARCQVRRNRLSGGKYT
jgi:hypothetical protein